MYAPRYGPYLHHGMSYGSSAKCERALGTDRSDCIALSKSLLKRAAHCGHHYENLLFPLLWVMDFFSTTRETNTKHEHWLEFMRLVFTVFVGISALSVLLARFLPYSKEELYIRWFLPFLALTSILLLGKTISYLPLGKQRLTVVIVKAIIDIKEFLTICIVIIFFFCGKVTPCLPLSLQMLTLTTTASLLTVAFTMLTANLKMVPS